MKDLKINTNTEKRRIIDFIRMQFYLAKRDKTIIGISGGIDSTVIASLCVKALNKKNVIGIMMPYGEQKDIEDSKKIVKDFGIEAYTIDIRPILDAFKAKDVSNLRLGNLMARVRMMVLYDLSAQFEGLVVGTSNKSELLLGYFTLHGDGACDLEPIGHLYKTQVKQLATCLGITNSLINKAPSAGLWEGQTDEKEIGGSYEDIDKILASMNITDIMRNKIHDLIQINEDSSLYDKLVHRIRRNKFKLQKTILLENILM